MQRPEPGRWPEGWTGGQTPEESHWKEKAGMVEGALGGSAWGVPGPAPFGILVCHQNLFSSVVQQGYRDLRCLPPPPPTLLGGNRRRWCVWKYLID